MSCKANQRDDEQGKDVAEDNENDFWFHSFKHKGYDLHEGKEIKNLCALCVLRV